MGDDVDDGSGLALFGTLALPDIIGGLGADGGRATPDRYQDWLREWVPTLAERAELIYKVRCSLLHQGRAKHDSGAYPAVVFNLPGPQVLHNNDFGTHIDLSIPMFVDEVCGGAERWLEANLAAEVVQQNLAKFARYRPEGVLVPGIPGIA
jgi:hypothetical protein